MPKKKKSVVVMSGVEISVWCTAMVDPKFANLSIRNTADCIVLYILLSWYEQSNVLSTCQYKFGKKMAALSIRLK